MSRQATILTATGDEIERRHTTIDEIHQAVRKALQEGN
jgi:hypothetical protein